MIRIEYQSMESAQNVRGAILHETNYVSIQVLIIVQLAVWVSWLAEK